MFTNSLIWCLLKEKNDDSKKKNLFTSKLPLQFPAACFMDLMWWFLSVKKNGGGTIWQLGGATKNNDGQCHLDNSGSYSPYDVDYVSSQSLFPLTLLSSSMVRRDSAQSKGGCSSKTGDQVMYMDIAMPRSPQRSLQSAKKDGSVTVNKCFGQAADYF